MVNSFKGFHLCIKWAIVWYPDSQLRKNSICACYSKQIKTSFARIKCKISAKEYKRNIRSAIKFEPHWFRGQYYQNFHISMIPTIGKNFKKIHELKVTCPGWFNMELPAWCKSGTRVPGPRNPGPSTPLKV